MLQSRHMLILGQSILLIGSLSLSFAAARLFRQALALGLPTWYLWLIISVAALLGAGKARFVMRKRMALNVKRLAATTGRLWPWQIYPPQLLVFILFMILLMGVLKRVLADNATGLGLLGGVDVGVAVALIVASGVYRDRSLL